jgi:predicted DNA-binding transcriptional regulator YafY
VSEVWNKANRLHELERLLRLKPQTTSELAAALGVSQRGVQRYLEEFELRVGALTKRGRMYHFVVERPELTPSQALAAHAAVRLLFHHTPGSDADYLGTLHLLAQYLPEPARGLAQRSTQILEARKQDGTSLDGREGLNLGKVAQAWFEGRVLDFHYISPGGSGEPRKKSLEVYFVEISRSNLGMYVIGYERSWHKKILTFKVSRLQHATVMNDRYTVPTDFDPGDYLSDAWGVIGKSDGAPISVTLRFAKDAAYRLLEGGYPNLEILRTLEGGQLEVRMRAGVDKTGLPRELLPFIYSWGPRVEVLEPEFVRQHWLEEMRAVGGGF